MSFIKKNNTYKRNNKSVMVNSIMTFIALILCTSMLAQTDYTKSLEGIEWVKIESKANVTVKTHNSKQLLIKARKSYGRSSSRAKGLRLVGEGGTDNTEVGFYVIKEGNNLIVKNLRKSRGAEIYLPADQNLSVKSTWHGNIKIYNFKGEVEADAKLNGSIKIEEISGPLTANALNGTIEVTFSKLNQGSPVTVYTTNGAVDISLPENTPANLTMGSTNGEIYTNFDLTIPDKNGLKSVSSKRIGGVINNGGVKIKLKSTNGNIYLRKKI